MARKKPDNEGVAVEEWSFNLAKTEIDMLKADVQELTHDLTALAEQLGAILGEPFRSQAREIVSKRQVTQEAKR